MAVTDFQSMKADVVNRNILNTDFFAEEVTYSPTVGTPRAIDVKIAAAEDPAFTEAGDEEFQERVRVKVRRDATLGIDNPQLGDLLARSVTREPDRRPYVYSGEKPEISASHWVLIFSRHKSTGRSPTG